MERSIWAGPLWAQALSKILGTSDVSKPLINMAHKFNDFIECQEMIFFFFLPFQSNDPIKLLELRPVGSNEIQDRRRCLVELDGMIFFF